MADSKTMPVSDEKIRTKNILVDVTTILFIKENYLTWSVAITIDIAGQGKYEYIVGLKPAPAQTDPLWASCFLEDNQVKMWIVNSVSPEIQPPIMRK